MIVLDASAAADLLLNIEPQAEAIAERIVGPGESLHAPHLIDAEVFHVVRNRALRRVLSEWRAGEALEDLRDLLLTRYPVWPFLERMWDLRANLSAFDAAYVALAEALDAPLVTTDLRLARTRGHTARIEAMR
ncbi:MAG: type II toxin-antitoxin system VapC family toxin [Actinomycetota bacterium]